MTALLIITFIGFSTLIVVFMNLDRKAQDLERRVHRIEDLINAELEHERTETWSQTNQLKS